jgi:hypothetical protein
LELLAKVSANIVVGTGTVHFGLQLPLRQFSVTSQAFPQLPQLLGSALKSTHAPLHSTVPPPQLSWQMPPMQFCPLVQAFPHSPQLASSVFVSAHIAPHFVVPPPQLSSQVPPVQVSPDAQAFAHVPQFFGSTLGFTSQPSGSWPLQFRKPDVQARVHWLAAHTGREFAVCVHEASQEPQCCSSVARSAQVPSQFCFPPVHADAHFPASHT